MHLKLLLCDRENYRVTSVIITGDRRCQCLECFLVAFTVGFFDTYPICPRHIRWLRVTAAHFKAVPVSGKLNHTCLL